MVQLKSQQKKTGLIKIITLIKILEWLPFWINVIMQSISHIYSGITIKEQLQNVTNFYKLYIYIYIWMNEWMNEWCIYIALCVFLYTQRALKSCGGVSPQPPPVCSIHLDALDVCIYTYIHTYIHTYSALHKYCKCKDTIALLAVESRHLQIWLKDEHETKLQNVIFYY